MTLTEFLLRRVAEDESRSRAALDVLDGDAWDDPDGEFVGRSGGGVFDHVLRHSPSRVLAECAAKRRLLNIYHELAEDEPEDPYGWDDGDWASLVAAKRTVAVLTAVYDDHPDYREEWKP